MTKWTDSIEQRRLSLTLLGRDVSRFAASRFFSFRAMFRHAWTPFIDNGKKFTISPSRTVKMSHSDENFCGTKILKEFSLMDNIKRVNVQDALYWVAQFNLDVHTFTFIFFWFWRFFTSIHILRGCLNTFNWFNLINLREGYGEFWIFYNSQPYYTKFEHYYWFVITSNLWNFQGNLWIFIRILNKQKHKSKKVFGALNFFEVG